MTEEGRVIGCQRTLTATRKKDVIGCQEKLDSKLVKAMHIIVLLALSTSTTDCNKLEQLTLIHNNNNNKTMQHYNIQPEDKSSTWIAKEFLKRTDPSNGDICMFRKL